jgi:hypothetical protein
MQAKIEWLFIKHQKSNSMKKLLIILLIGLQIMGCKSTDTTADITPQSTVNVPEVGEYSSFNVVGGSQYQYTYNVFINSWEWKFEPGFQFYPSPFGRLSIKKDGSYEFLDLKKSGTYKQDNSTKKVKFTGYLADAEGYYKIQRGTCILIIATKAADGTTNTLQFEKKSDFPQPDVPSPNGNFKGTIINSLVDKSTDFIDIATSKTISTYTYSTSFVLSGNSANTIYLYKNNPFDYNESYPNVDVLDNKGNVIVKYKGVSASGKKWAIGEYWYGMLSPDGTKIVLTGKYMLHSSVFDPAYVNPYPFISVIDIKTGNELKSFDCDEQNKWGAGWTPSGELVVPRKGGGINIVSANLDKVTTIYTNPVIEARINSNNKVLFAAGTGFFTMNLDGTNMTQIPNKVITLTTKDLYDMCWSPDGKSIGIMYKNTPFNEYFMVLISADGNSYSYFNDSKGDFLRLKSPFINWK